MSSNWRNQPNPVPSSVCNDAESPVPSSVCNDSESQWYEPSFSEIAIPDSNNGVLKFDCKKDAAFCVGIDEQHDPAFIKEDRIDAIAKDATEIREAFIYQLGLNADRVELSIASRHRDDDDCTKNGLRTSFLQCAKKVGKNGNFIFYFAGHGYELGERCILAPVDFARKEETGILGDDLVQWLNDADCKASNVLFIFDCCYAGSLGETLSDKQLTIAACLFVICGCDAKEKLLTVSVLEHSIFTYFLLEYLKTYSESRELNVRQAMKEISNSCFGLSNLILMYEKGKLHAAGFNPRFYKRSATIQAQCLTESLSNSEYKLTSLLRYPQVQDRPHAAVQNWLQCSATSKSLKIISGKASSQPKLQKCIVSVLLRSSALLHYKGYELENDDNGKNFLETRALFLQIAIKVSNEIDSFCDIIDHIMEGLESYICVVKMLKIDETNLEQLHRDIEKKIRENWS